MKITCPKCKLLIPANRLNVDTDVAVCDQCNEVVALSELLAGGQVPEGFHIDEPPRGAWFEEAETGWRMGATTRSPMAFFLVPFMCVWSGGSMGGIYGTQIVQGEFNPLLSFFGVPFALGTLLLGSVALMAVCGKVVVTIEGEEGRVFEGIGSIGWTRRFHWASVATVEEERYQNNGQVIALVGDRRLKFGSMLSDPRRYYLLQCLRMLLAAGRR